MESEKVVWSRCVGNPQRTPSVNSNPITDPISFSQKRCPLIEDFWDKHDNGSDDEKYFEGGRGVDFQRVKLTKVEKREDHFALAFQDRNGRVVVPDVGLYPLSEINLRDVVRSVLRANGDGDVDIHRMKAMFTVLVHVYEFECQCMRSTKINEVRCLMV